MFCFSKAKATTGKELPYLPDDVWLNCLARLPRSHYLNLSLVSKRFRSLIASKELYITRSILGTTESYLYLSLENRSSSGSNPLLFTLKERPTRTSLHRFASSFLPRKKYMVSVLTDLNLLPPPEKWFTFAIGSDIYMIDGCMIGQPSSSVFVMDCLSHTWREAPSMLMAHSKHLVAVNDGKIYVRERHYSLDESHKVVEVFDPKAQVWEYLPNQKNIHMFMEKNKVPWSWASYCMVDNVQYLYQGNADQRELSWRDSEESPWRAVKGCEHLGNLVKDWDTHHVRLVNYGGKIAVFWMEKVDEFFMPFDEKEKELRYAEITIEKRKGQEIRGKFKYHGVVFRVPKSSSVEQFVVSTV